MTTGTPSGASVGRGVAFRRRCNAFLGSILGFLVGGEHRLMVRFGLRCRTRGHGRLARRDETAIGFVEMACRLVITLGFHGVVNSSLSYA